MYKIKGMKHFVQGIFSLTKLHILKQESELALITLKQVNWEMLLDHRVTKDGPGFAGSILVYVT